MRNILRPSMQIAIRAASAPQRHLVRQGHAKSIGISTDRVESDTEGDRDSSRTQETVTWTRSPGPDTMTCRAQGQLCGHGPSLWICTPLRFGCGGVGKGDHLPAGPPARAFRVARAKIFSMKEELAEGRAGQPSKWGLRIFGIVFGADGDSYEIYVKNTFLVFEPAAETEGRRPRAASCPADWRDLHIEKSSFAKTTSSTMAPCELCSDTECTGSSRMSEDRDRSVHESSPVVAHSFADATDAVDVSEAAEELEMHRKINRQLSAGSTPAKILQVVDTWRARLHGPHAMVAAMLQLAEAKATQELHCQDGTLPANCCTIIAWSCATLKVFSGPLFSSLIAVVEQSGSTCEVYEEGLLLRGASEPELAASLCCCRLQFPGMHFAWLLRLSAVEVVELAEAIAELTKPGLFGDWALVDDEFPPLPPQEFSALKVLQQHRGLEDGFPDLPEECLRIAARALTCPPSEVIERAHSAYVAGFLANVALKTETPYSRAANIEDADKKHWVVFYRQTPAINRRLSSRKCVEVAITVEDNCVWEGFQTVTELVIFCAGAGALVPRLERWTSPW
eukprot:s1351_g9.t2